LAPLQSALPVQRFGCVSGWPFEQHTRLPALPAQSLRQVACEAPQGFHFTEVVVTAMWKSKGSSPSVTRSALYAFRLSMKLENAFASACCSPAIDPDSSTTKSTSADETSESVNRSVAGWMRHLPTGLKL